MEKEQLCREKMALQRECRLLLERLQELQHPVRRPCGTLQCHAWGLTTAQAQEMSRSWRTDACCGHSMHGSMQLQRGFGLNQMILMRTTASVQDAAGGHGTAEDSPQIVGSGLYRETSAASADLGSIADTEAEIRRLAEVISIACRASGLGVQSTVPSSMHYGGISYRFLVNG